MSLRDAASTHAAPSPRISAGPKTRRCARSGAGRSPAISHLKVEGATMDLVISPTADGYRATYGDKTWRCAVGRSGLAPNKRDGDGSSPIGSWPIRQIFYRADRLDGAPSKAFTCTAIDRQDGWCDAPDHPDYNRPVRLPFAASHEEMWRDDHLYDVVVVLAIMTTRSSPVPVA